MYFFMHMQLEKKILVQMKCSELILDIKIIGPGINQQMLKSIHVKTFVIRKQV